ncbi:MAG: hypothetical protein RR400_01605 [Clostridia bacterium]
MLCEKCKKNEATFYSSIIVNGIKKEEHLCGKCANISGKIKSPLKFFDMSDFLIKNNSGIEDETPCAFCGTTIQDIIENGAVGCSNCYLQFADELQYGIQKIHGNVSHIGKTPILQNQLSEKEKKMKSLNELLEAAISERRYEDAGKIDEQIRKLEEGDRV